MLTLNQIDDFAAGLLEIFERIESDLLLNVVSRFSVLEGAPISGMLAWQLDKLDQLGALRAENIKAIAKYAKVTEREIETLLTEAGFKTIERDDIALGKAFDKGVLPVAAGPARASESIRQILSAAITNAKQITNLINTTALESASKAYMDIVNRVYLETSLGVRSYTDAIRTAVRDLADKGITGVTYTDKRGRTINYPVDAAVRRNIVTSISQTAGKVQLQRAKEWGSEYVEVSSHLGARPSHAEWQGKVFCINGQKNGYGDFYSETGYGTVEGLKGVNCHHDFWPFFIDLSEQKYQPYDLDENERVYKESQEQRKIERKIRAAKREEDALKAIGDEEGEAVAKQKTLKYQAEMRGFIERTGRTRRRDREQIVRVKTN